MEELNPGRPADAVGLLCFGLALFMRNVVLQLKVVLGSSWDVPRYIYVPIMFALLVAALYRERDRHTLFFISWVNVPRRLGWGVLLGALLCTAEGVIESAMTPGAVPRLHWSAVAAYPLGFLNAILSAALYEELLYRSLAMGHMIRWLRTPLRAHLTQTALFCVAHLRYFDGQHWGNVISVLAGGLILGWATLLFKNIIPSTIAHGMINSYGMLFFPLDVTRLRILRSWGF